MSFVIAPEFVSDAASNLAGIGSALEDAVTGARASTSGLAAAAADEVSAAIADLFSGHGQAFQAASAQASAFQAEFVRLLSGGAAQYASAEAANANPLLSWTDQRADAAAARPSVDRRRRERCNSERGGHQRRCRRLPVR
jgi:hypothetical protein